MYSHSFVFNSEMSPFPAGWTPGSSQKFTSVSICPQPSPVSRVFTSHPRGAAREDHILCVTAVCWRDQGTETGQGRDRLTDPIRIIYNHAVPFGQRLQVIFSLFVPLLEHISINKPNAQFQTGVSGVCVRISVISWSISKIQRPS